MKRFYNITGKKIWSTSSSIERAEYEFEADNKELKAVLKSLEKWIKKNYGPRCKMKAVGCSTCIIWAIFDALKLQLAR